MLINLHGYAQHDQFGGPIHTNEIRLARGKINYSFGSTHDSAHLSLFFRDAKAARELAKKISAVADDIERASVAPAEAAE